MSDFFNFFFIFTAATRMQGSETRADPGSAASAGALTGGLAPEHAGRQRELVFLLDAHVVKSEDISAEATETVPSSRLLIRPLVRGVILPPGGEVPGSSPLRAFFSVSLFPRNRILRRAADFL